MCLLLHIPSSPVLHFFFFNDTATTEIYTLSLHDALPISHRSWLPYPRLPNILIATTAWATSIARTQGRCMPIRGYAQDRKSTRLNSSHGYISYAVFCLKKKKCILIT